MDTKGFSALSKELLSDPSKSTVERVLRKLGDAPLCTQNPELVTDDNVDGVAEAVLPVNSPKGLRPAKTYGDGNCLFRAISVFLDGKVVGRDVLHLSLRLRTACELLLNSSVYAKALMQWAARRGDDSGSLLSAVFSDAAMDVHVLKSARCVQDVEKAVVVDAKKTCHNGTYSSMLTIHALATVCNVKIRSWRWLK